MKTVIKLEELAMFAFSIMLFTTTDYAWWVFPALILVPDIGMLGYLGGNTIGAFSYNLFHHKGLALLILAAGIWLEWPSIELVGTILFGHASMDRILGYGLKYETGFKNTHLGTLD